LPAAPCQIPRVHCSKSDLLGVGWHRGIERRKTQPNLYGDVLVSMARTTWHDGEIWSGLHGAARDWRRCTPLSPSQQRSKSAAPKGTNCWTDRSPHFDPSRIHTQVARQDSGLISAVDHRSREVAELIVDAAAYGSPAARRMRRRCRQRSEHRIVRSLTAAASDGRHIFLHLCTTPTDNRAPDRRECAHFFT